MAAAAEDRADVSCTVEAVAGGVECHSDGELRWEVTHPSLWSDKTAYIEGADAPAPVGPVIADGSAFYSVFNDLLEVAVEEGIIESRARFPAEISGLQIGDDGKIQVSLGGTGGERAQGETITIPVEPGSSGPPQMAWSLENLAERFLTSKDAERLLASALDSEEAVELLGEASRIDPTNPFFSQLLGTALQETGDDRGAKRAFSQAAESPDALWEDLLRVSGLLEGAGAPEDAERAYQLGMAQLEQLGINAEQVVSLLPMVTTFLGSSDDFSPLLEAFQAGDMQEVQRLAIRMADTFPNVEGSHWNWEALARWMAEEGADGLAREMQRLADENKEAAFGILEQVVTELDLALLAFVSIAIALLLFSFLIGMRGGVARREAYDGGDERSLWIPRLRVRDLIVPAILFGVLAAIPYHVNTHAMVAEEFANMPIANLQDGMASPQTEEWLMNMADNPAIHELLDSVLAEREALKEGREPPERQPVVNLLVDAAYENAEQAQWDLLRAGQMPDIVAAVKMIDSDPSEFQAPGGTSLALLLIPLGGLLVVMVLGSILGARAPKVCGGLLLVIPGGPRRLAPLGALLLLALIASLAAMAGLDNVIEQMAAAEVHRQFGLPELQEYTASPSRAWAKITVAVVVIVHAAIATWERHNSESQPD